MSSKKYVRDKKFGVNRLKNSFLNSFDGLIYAYTYEQSMLTHIIFTMLVIVLGILLKISFLEWIIFLIFLTVTVVVELINTAIEAAVDLTTDEIHPLAKIAKDCGSAAAFVMVVVDVLVGLLIFVPKVISLFN